MSLYDTIAASHRGQCFLLLGRRFALDEVQVADVVYVMLKELGTSLDEAIGERSKLASFLLDLGRGDYARVLSDTGIFTDRAVRDRGMSALGMIGSVRPVRLEPIVESASLDGVDEAGCRQMLPYVAMLMLAAIRFKAERPLRLILAARNGERAAQAATDPFAVLAATLEDPPMTRARPAIGFVESIWSRAASMAPVERRPATS